MRKGETRSSGRKAKECDQKSNDARWHHPPNRIKFELWEGGHRIPFIVRWPGRVKPGSVNHHLVQQTDIMATVAEILGTKLPDHAGEDSISLLPLLEGIDQPVRTNGVNCSVHGVPALRHGPWKFFHGAPGRERSDEMNQSIHLYKLDDDLGETNNLATAMLEKVAEMKALLAKLITDGRSTPGAPQKNDVEVTRHPIN